MREILEYIPLEILNVHIVLWFFPIGFLWITWAIISKNKELKELARKKKYIDENKRTLFKEFEYNKQVSEESAGCLPMLILIFLAGLFLYATVAGFIPLLLNENFGFNIDI
tara:strand:+ start:87 stop:419 length:333 start_codon:yes stop_codon:yes gene_type:complete